MFAPQVKMINTKILFQSFATLTKPRELVTSNELALVVNYDREEPLPSLLYGDHVRMK